MPAAELSERGREATRSRPRDPRRRPSGNARPSTGVNGTPDQQLRVVRDARALRPRPPSPSRTRTRPRCSPSRRAGRRRPAARLARHERARRPAGAAAHAARLFERGEPLPLEERAMRRRRARSTLRAGARGTPSRQLDLGHPRASVPGARARLARLSLHDARAEAPPDDDPDERPRGSALRAQRRTRSARSASAALQGGALQRRLHADGVRRAPAREGLRQEPGRRRPR